MTAEEAKSIKETKFIHADHTGKKSPQIIRDGFSSSSDSSSSESGSDTCSRRRLKNNKRPMNNLKTMTK